MKVKTSSASWKHRGGLLTMVVKYGNKEWQNLFKIGVERDDGTPLDDYVVAIDGHGKIVLEKIDKPPLPK